MNALGRSKCRRSKTMVGQTHCKGGVVVVTAMYDDDRYETRVLGGQLDGWTIPSASEAEASRVHRAAVQMAGGAA